MALLAFSACEKGPESLQADVIRVTAESCTRVQLSSSFKTVWTSGDQLSVFRNSDANQCWRFDGATGDSHGTLSAVSAPSQTFATDYTVLLYPYDASAILSQDSIVTTAFSGVQHYLAESYGVGANMMLSAGKGDSFTMYNLCGFFNFRLAGTKKVSSITLSGNNHDVLSGTALVGVTDLSVTLTDTDEDDSAPIKKIVLDCWEGVRLSPTDTTSFYLAVPPHTFELGITMVVAFTDGTSITKFTEEPVAVDRAVCYAVTDITGESTSVSDKVVITPYAGEKATDAADDVIDYGNADFYWEATGNSWINTVNVIYTGSTVSVTTTNDKIKLYKTGADVTVDMLTGSVKNTEIIVQGQTSDGSLKIYGDKKFKLTLAGADITSTRGPAINNQCGKRTFVHLAEGTTNRLTDAASYSDDALYLGGGTAATEDRKACLFSEGSLLFSGTGVLVVKGNYKHGIATDDYFVTRPGTTLVITDAKSAGIKAKGKPADGIGIKIGGGLVYATVSAAGGKCISTDGLFEMTSGTLNLGTTGAGVYDATENDIDGASCIKVDSVFTISGGTIIAKSTGNGGKGISVDREAYFNGGTVDVSTSGGKHTYSRTVASSPKGIKVDGEFQINGGSITVNVTGNSEGSEGIESKTSLIINGGETYIYAYDDAVNAKTNVTINGGRLWCYAANNDGIDSNGTMVLNGGLVISSGSAAPEEAFDCDRSNDFTVNGGIAIGVSGGAVKPNASASKQRTILYGGYTATKGVLFSLCNSSGQPVIAFKIPRTMSGGSSGPGGFGGSRGATIFLSSPDIAAGTYTVCSGGTISGYSDSWNGWYEGGTIAGATQLKSFTVNSMVTSVGSTGGFGF